MNKFGRLARIWFWIALTCCAFSVLVMGVAFYIEDRTQCATKAYYNEKLNSDIYAALLGSVFMVFFFVIARTEDSITKVNDALKSGYQHFHIIHERIPLTGVHLIVHLPFIMFCALTLAGPVFAFLTLHSIALVCGASIAR